MGKTLNISTNLWKSIKNNETHLKTFTKQWQMVEINMSNQWKRMKQPKTALQKNIKNIENTLKESVKIMKNIEKTMETNVKIIHRLILSWGPFEAHLRFRWGYFESPLRLLLTASLDLYINLLLNWFWKNLRVSLKTTKQTCEANLSKFHKKSKHPLSHRVKIWARCQAVSSCVRGYFEVHLGFELILKDYTSKNIGKTWKNNVTYWSKPWKSMKNNETHWKTLKLQWKND